jgi:hypothetical protein
VRTTRSDVAASPAAAPLAWIVFALLVLASAAALLVAQKLKHDPPLIQASAIWMPNSGAFDPQRTAATFSFQTSYNDKVTVSIVSTHSAKTVAVLARNYQVRRYRRTEQFSWKGRTATGGLAPAGTYVVTVHFERLDRTPTIPEVRFDLTYAT